METSTVFIVSYFIQIPLAIYAAFFIPMRGELSEYMENSRKSTILFGILPCAFFSVLMQAIFIGMYMFAVKRVEASGRKAQAKLQGGGAYPATGSNPFGEGSAPSSDAGQNPFGEQGGTTDSQGPNPFS